MVTGNLAGVEIVVGPEHATPPDGGSAVTIGAYDGVHIGHRQLLAALGHEARARGLASVVVTFDRHPATVVRPSSAPLLLTDLDQKLELLATTGVDRTLVVPFDEARAHETAQEFVAEVLVDALGARLVVVGEDFHFGYRRAGNVALLTEMGATAGFEVIGVALEHDGSHRPVSSTRIRQLLAQGDVAAAAGLLGRPHQVRGRVVRGDGRGGTVLGFPTANVSSPAGLALPAEGIYACWYERPDGSVHAAAASLGRRPTFHSDASSPILEVFLLDFEGDLYGEEARVSFVSRLREERRFDTVAALVRQMTDDVAAARAALGPVPR
jgi:riboflavin kinase / FMN adenylyltransferase